MSTFGILILLSWVACSVIAYGFAFGYLQREFAIIAKEARAEDRAFALFTAIFGPFALIVHGICGWYKHGMKFK